MGNVKIVSGIMFIVLGSAALLNMLDRGDTFSFDTEVVNIQKSIEVADVRSISVEGNSTDIEVVRGREKIWLLR